jgi:hypothetical protein
MKGNQISCPDDRLAIVLKRRLNRQIELVALAPAPCPIAFLGIETGEARRTQGHNFPRGVMWNEIERPVSMGVGGN